MLRLDILDVCIAFEKLLLRDIVNDAKHRILGNQQTYNYMNIIFILQFKNMQICLRGATRMFILNLQTQLLFTYLEEETIQNLYILAVFLWCKV